MADLPRWPGPQRRIGLTGGIATGKSSVARLLEQVHGLPLVDADLLARAALAPGSAAARTVADHFGPVVLAPGTGPNEARLDRAALGRIVFGEPTARAWLEQVVHPIVRHGFEQGLANLVQKPTVVLVVPLLFEAGLETLCSETWLVDCDDDQQLARLMARDGLDEADARSRLTAQWPLARKRALADVVLDNRGAPGALAPQVRHALDDVISMPLPT